MEIKLSAGDKIQIPTGCKATIEDNQIIIEEQKEFKDGDILHSKHTRRVLIFQIIQEMIKVYLTAILITQMTQILLGILKNFALQQKKKSNVSLMSYSQRICGGMLKLK